MKTTTTMTGMSAVLLTVALTFFVPRLHRRGVPAPP